MVLENEKHIPSEYYGFILAFPSFLYAITSACYGIVAARVPRRLFILVCFILLTILTFLTGPSPFLPNSFWIFLIGYGFSGGVQGFLFIPIIPEVIEAVYEAKGIEEGKNPYVDGLISDKAAGLYGFCISVGLISGPIIGSFV